MFNMRVNVYRGDHIESRHTIHATVLDYKHNLIFSCGENNYVTCIRSSFKPFQAYPVIYHQGHKKYQFSSSEIALLCASHNGEPRHVRAAKNMLKKINYSHQHLECGSHLPSHRHTKKLITQKKIKLNPLYNNCSGKHIGMLTLSKLLSCKPKKYITSKHEVQKAIMKFLYQNHSLTPISIGTDGCGASAPFFTIQEVAKLYLDFGTSCDPAYQTLFNAITKHPYMIAGKNRFDSFFTNIMKGAGLCKGGGEGVLGLYVNSKKYGPLALGLKVEDGNHRARAIAVIHILKHIQALSVSVQSKLNKFHTFDRKNHNNRKIGFISTEISKLQ